MEQLKYTTTADSYFDDIRPYLNHEVPSVLAELKKTPTIRQIATELLPPNMSNQLDEILDGMSSVTEFKIEVLAKALKYMLQHNSFSVTASGRSQLGKDKCYLFISNHRDIVMDSALINLVLHEYHLPLPRIAIGDNLLIEEWITHLVRLADAFIVKRKPSLRETLIESARLSHYIRTTIVGGEASVWIAQREGRTKDSNDTTQAAILKMLAMSNRGKSYAGALLPLNIAPVALSYEYDPCDYLKAKELLQRKLNPNFKKSPMDDLISMHTGITGQKGRVHITFTPPITQLSEVAERATTEQEELKLIAGEIDRQIFLGYRFYPNNYIAYDLLHGGHKFEPMYGTKERATFELYLEQQIDKITMEGKDSNFLQQHLLEMYANPLKNYLITNKKVR